MKTRLTELAVSKLRPPKSGKYSWHADALLPSFGIRVYTTGRRVWGITRRWHGARHPTFRKIGELPSIGLADARSKAREILTDPGTPSRSRQPLATPSAPSPSNSSLMGAPSEAVPCDQQPSRNTVAPCSSMRHACTIAPWRTSGAPMLPT